MTVDTDALLAAIGPVSCTCCDQWDQHHRATAREGVLLAAGVLQRHRGGAQWYGCSECWRHTEWTIDQTTAPPVAPFPCRDAAAALGHLEATAQRYGVAL